MYLDEPSIPACGINAEKHNIPHIPLIPHLDLALGPRRKHLAGFLLRPRDAVDRPAGTIRRELAVHLARLEVPEADAPLRVARRDELPVGAARKADGAAGRVVAAPGLLAVLPELVRAGRVGDDRVVAALVQHILAAGVLRGLGEGEHVGFTRKLAVVERKGREETYLMVLISTGIPYSHTLNDRSSDVDMNRRFSSINSSVLMAPK